VLALARSDLGFGKLIVDDRGVTRMHLLRTQRIAWDDIRSYRLGAWLEQSNDELRRMLGSRIASVLDIPSTFDPPPRPTRLLCELIGTEQRVMVDWRFAHVELAIDEIMQRIGPRLLDTARSELAHDGIARFGDLALASHGIRWKTRDTLAFDRVEKLELVDNRPVEIFVRERDRAWPYAHFALDAIPNVLAMVELAQELGYRVVKLV
jgi:hypothetical protein